MRVGNPRLVDSEWYVEQSFRWKGYCMESVEIRLVDGSKVWLGDFLHAGECEGKKTSRNVSLWAFNSTLKWNEFPNYSIKYRRGRSESSSSIYVLSRWEFLCSQNTRVCVIEGVACAIQVAYLKCTRY
jgi:hypothetical protein